jgi:hypothetical protein
MQYSWLMASICERLKLMDNGIYYFLALNKWDGDPKYDANSDMTKAIANAIKLTIIGLLLICFRLLNNGIVAF